jgi:uncharacterized protein (DUF2062 family)
MNQLQSFERRLFRPDLNPKRETSLEQHPATAAEPRCDSAPIPKPGFNSVTQMYEFKKDWLSAAVTAGLGAGIVTSFAVSQGQNPFVGLSITVVAAGLAVAFDTLAT